LLTLTRRGYWARSDSADATHLFASCRTRAVRFSFGVPVDKRIQHIVDMIPDECWHPTIEHNGLRHDAWWPRPPK
jgi:hypothetical protein